MTFLGIFIAGCWGGFTLGILFAGAATIRSHRSGRFSLQGQANGFASGADLVASISGEASQAERAGIAF